MADTKRFYAIRRTSEGMGGGSVLHAILNAEPEAAPNLTVREIAPDTALAEWAVKQPTDEEPPSYTPRGAS